MNSIGRRIVPPAAIASIAFALLSLPGPAVAAPHCTATGTAGPDTLRGTAGADVLCGRGGDDTVLGAAGPDRLRGGPGDDLLKGGADDDLLFGGAGDDRVVGGPGNDAASGGAGIDTCPLRGSRYRTCGGKGHHAEPSGHPNGPPIVTLPPYNPQCTPWPGFGSNICPDKSAPELSGMRISPSYVDTSGGDAVVDFHVGVSDQSGIDSIELEVIGPEGEWREIDIDGHGSHSQGFSAAETLTGGSPLGTYTVASITITDSLGNQAILDTDSLAWRRIDPTFVVTDHPDDEGPLLTSFSISPDHVDTSAGGRNVNLSVGTLDSLSGVNDVFLRVAYPDASQGYSTGVYTYRSAGTDRQGTWTGALTLPQGAMPGTYRVTEVDINDQEGNRTEYDRAELTALGFPVEFTQDGDGDTTPPAIADFSFSPQVLHAAHGDRTITFSIHATDELTGVGNGPSVNFVDVYFDIPPIPPGSGWVSWGGSAAMRVSGTAADGVWSLPISFSSNAPAGTYTVTAVTVRDLAGNLARVEGADLASRGWDLTFENQP